VESYADEGDIIILVAHSAGGASTTEAVRGLSVEDRRTAGKPGGIERLVYVAAFAPELGVSPITHEQVREFFYWALIEDEIDYPDPKLCDEILFNDLLPEDVAKYRPFVQKSAWRARQHANTEVTYVGWKHIPSSYLLCQNDKAVPAEMQEAIVAQEGSKFDDILRIQAGHCPFISQPDVTAKFVRRAAGEKDIIVQ
jgi:pimeloyl-ACP methyl ester carboxylesterase